MADSETYIGEVGLNKWDYLFVADASPAEYLEIREAREF